MTCNMGSTDRMIRSVAGAAILAAGIYFKSWWGLLGAIPLFTAFTSWCPLYIPFGFSTSRKTAEPAAAE